MNTIKYKKSNGDHIKKIEVATGQTMAEFNPLQSKYKGLTDEMNEWVDKGNTIEEQFTEAELSEIAAEEKEQTYENFIIERNSRIIEADKWELPSIQKKFGITQEQVELYKQYLRDMPVTLTENSTTEELENPPWQPKLITQKLL